MKRRGRDCEFVIIGDFGEIRDWVFSNVEIHAVGEFYFILLFYTCRHIQANGLSCWVASQLWVRIIGWIGLQN